MEIIYAGIGARKTPKNICQKMYNAGKSLSKLGFTLRSGGAPGANIAFETGADAGNGRKEIYLPWKEFNRNPSPRYGTTKEARLLAKEFHPNWENLGNTGRDFMGRNCYQILGQDLTTPCEFILCWTPNGKVVGETGQALRMAKAYNIPIFNFAVQSDDEISDFIFTIAERNNP